MSQPDGTSPTMQIPAHAIGGDGNELIGPATELLHSLDLLGGPQDAKQGVWKSTLEGSSTAVAVLESTTTALTKWWAAGGSAVVALVWGWAVKNWPPATQGATQRTIILSLSIFSAAFVLALGYLLSSDVRSRAVASAATFRARADITDTVIRASLAAATHRVIPMTQPFSVGYMNGGDTLHNWKLVAVEANGTDDALRFLIQRGTQNKWVPAGELSF